jgi:pyruvate formate lyase activating enzyme
METCAYTQWEKLQTLLGKVDLFLLDIKAMDRERHMQWTGVYNDVILENARRLSEEGAKLFIRVPLIPGVNDTKEEFSKIAAFAAGLKNVHELHILPFHQIGSTKYDMVGKEYALKDWEEESLEKAEECRKIAENAGLRVSVGGTGFASERMLKI